MFKNQKMKIALLAAILVVVVAAVAVFGIVAYNNRPETVTIKAISGVVDGLLEREEISAARNMFKKGSLSFSVDRIKDGEYDMLDGAKFSGKLYFGDEEIMGEDLSFTYDETKINADVYLSNDMVYLSEDEVLKDSFGAKISELFDDIENSIFASSSASKYALPDDISDLLEVLTDTDRKEMQEEAAEILEKYVEEFYKIFCEYAVFEKEIKDVRLSGNKVTARVITVRVDEEAVMNILYDLYDFMNSDTDITDFINKYEDVFALDSNDDPIELYEDFLEDFEDLIDDVEDEFEEGYYEIEVTTPKRSSELLALTVTTKFNDTKSKLLSLDFGGEVLAKAKTICFAWGKSLEAVYEVEENSDKRYEASFRINEDELFSVSLNKTRETYELFFGEETEKFTVKGTLCSLGDVHTITVDEFVESWSSYWSSGENVYETDITLVIDENDSIPGVPKRYSKISEITEEEMDTWVEAFEEIFDLF